MLEITPQERLALIVFAVLLMTGGVARHLVQRVEAADGRVLLQAEDSLISASAAALKHRVSQEVDLQRIRSTPLRAGERIDPNLAPPEQLARLPRIGPALAARIVAHRETNGPFRTLDDLRAVTGIGPALLEGIAPFLDLASAPVGSALPSGVAGRIDINRATVAELESLPGIGPVIARRIIAYREANGPFGSIADLEKVSGVGPRLRARLEGSVRLGS